MRLKIGVAALAACFLGMFLTACAIGFSDPRPDGSRDAIAGFKFSSIENAFNSGVGTIFDAIGGWMGVGGLGGVGAIGAGLVRAWAKQRANAQAAERSIEAHNHAWDRAKSEAERERLLAIARASVGPPADRGGGAVAPDPVGDTKGLTT